MILRVEHIGLAVKDKEAENLFNLLLDRKPYQRETVEREGVETVFYKTGETKIELLNAISEQSPVHKYLDKKGPGIHHIAFEVDDLVAEMSRLKEEGFELLSDEPKTGADNKIICFLHPKSTGGILVELCQEIKS